MSEPVPMLTRLNRWTASQIPGIAAVVLLALVLVGCATLDTGAAPPPGGGAAAGSTPVPGNPSADRIQVGDRITIVYSDIPQPPSPSEQQVRDDGRVTIHLGHSFEAAGKTRGVLEREIKEFYIARSLYKEINVTVHMQPRYYSVGGEVRSPNQYVYLGETTVLKAVNAAGGCTDFADRKNVVITRALDKSQVKINLKQAIKDPKLDVPIYPGDTIYIHKGL